METPLKEQPKPSSTERAIAVKPALITGGRIAAIVPQNIEEAFRLAQAIAAANMAPKAYNRDANAIMVGILHGMEVGFTPMAALQSIAVINGAAQVWGDGALALIQASGELDDINEVVDFDDDGNPVAAHCTIVRKGRKSPVARTFSRASAQKAQLWNKPGPWQQYPQRMLQMRARSWAMRDSFADVLRGLGVAEEARDMGELRRTDTGDYEPAPPMPIRAEFRPVVDPAEAGHVDLDQTYRETVGQPEPATLEQRLAAPVQANDIDTLYRDLLDGLRRESAAAGVTQYLEVNKRDIDTLRTGNEMLHADLLAAAKKRLQEVAKTTRR